MNAAIRKFSAVARKAAQSHDWATVSACSNEILRRDGRCAEGYFLAGLADNGAQRPAKAAAAFAKAIEIDPSRYDAAVELALMLAVTRRGAEALRLLEDNERRLANSPR